jgi:DNA-binding transcriptional MerR regulator
MALPANDGTQAPPFHGCASSRRSFLRAVPDVGSSHRREADVRDTLKIGEFSALGRVSVRMLRHYEKLGLLLPRRTDAWTSYRYYTLDQLPRLNRIIALKELGFSLEEVGGILTGDPSPHEMRALLDERRRQLASELEQNRRRLEQVDVRLAQIEREGLPPEESEVVLKPLPPVTVACVRAVVPSVERMSEFCDDHFGRIAAWLTERGLPADGLTMNLYHMDEYRETDLDMESVMLIDPSNAADLPAPGDGAVGVRALAEEPRAASLVLRSGFAGIEGGVMTLLRWIAASGFELAGPLREVHLFGHPDLVDADDPAVLEIVVPVRMRSD